MLVNLGADEVGENWLFLKFKVTEQLNRGLILIKLIARVFTWKCYVSLNLDWLFQSCRLLLFAARCQRVLITDVVFLLRKNWDWLRWFSLKWL